MKNQACKLIGDCYSKLLILINILTMGVRPKRHTVIVCHIPQNELIELLYKDATEESLVDIKTVLEHNNTDGHSDKAIGIITTLLEEIKEKKT